MRKKRFLSGIAFSLGTACAVTALLSTQVFASDPQVKRVEQLSTDASVSQVTPEELQRIKRATAVVYTKEGAFQRVDSEASLPEEQIARSVDSVNKNTKMLILDYGVFLKQ